MTNAADATIQPEAPAHDPPRSTAARLGVVDPIRLPIPPALSRTWARLPRLAQVFVGLSVLDILGRAVGFAGTSLLIDPSVPLSLVTAVLPHNLLILLPALIVARRPDAAQATPLILRGAILLALVELLGQPVGSFSLGGDGVGTFYIAIATSVTATVLKAVGWMALAIGLMALAASRPSQALEGLANLVLGLLTFSAIVSLALMLASAAPDLGDEGWNALSMLASAVYTIQAIAFAVIARVVIRGTGDVRRPAIATHLASASMLLSAVAIGLAGVAGAIVFVQVALSRLIDAAANSFAFGWVGDGFPLTLFLIAFGLGLADTSVRIPGSGAEHETDPEPADDGPAWPEPGGEVPVYRLPEPTPKRRRSKRKN